MFLTEKVNNSFKKGLKDGIPICLGYIPVSFAFGLYATSAGISILEAVMISLFNLTSAGQMAAVPIIASAGSLVELALTQLVINMRYSLMSVSLSQRFAKNVRTRDRFVISFANTDEIFGVAIANDSRLGRRYMYGLPIAPFFGWAFGTALGAIAGNVLPSIVVNSLGIALYAMFIAIVVPRMRAHKATALAALCAAALSALFYYAPYLKEVESGFAIMICAVSVSAAFAFFAPIPDEAFGGFENEK